MPRSLPRVCLDLTVLEMRDRFGGFARYGLALAEALLEGSAAHQLELLALPRSGAAPVPAREALDPAYRTGPLISPRRHRWQRLLAGGRLRAAGVDLFHSLTPVALPLGAPCPLLVTAPDVIPLSHPDPGRGFRAAVERLDDRVRQRLRHRRGDHFLAISRATADELGRWFGISPDRVTVVHLGIDAGAFSAEPASGEDTALRSRWGLPDRFFLLVGSDHHRKNQTRAYEAWAGLAGEIPEGLVLAGRELYSDAFRRIVADASARGFGRRVRWLPDLGDEELPAFYRQATALVAPSEAEGFGMTLLEAMACGCPVAASRIAAHEEVAEEAALWFDPHSVGGIREALQQLSGTAPLRDALRAGGLSRVSQFSWSDAAEKTAEVYRAVLGRR